MTDSHPTANSFPAWYGNVEPTLRCGSCEHQMFDAAVDEEAGVTFCPKCGKQEVLQIPPSQASSISAASSATLS